jgi:hypothetical protein
LGLGMLPVCALAHLGTTRKAARYGAYGRDAAVGQVIGVNLQPDDAGGEVSKLQRASRHCLTSA